MPRSESPVEVRGEEAEAVASALLPDLYVTREMEGAVRPPERVYYRVYRDGDGRYAVLYIFEWPFQLFPPHEVDYAPVVVVADRNLAVEKVCVDGLHFFVKCYGAPGDGDVPRLVIDNTWRAMRVEWGESSGDVQLLPAHRGRDPGTDFVYLSDEILAGLRRRRVNPLTVNDAIVFNPFLATSARHWATFHEPSPADLAYDFAKNLGVHGLWQNAVEYIARVAESAWRIVTDRAKKFREDAKASLWW